MSNPHVLVIPYPAQGHVNPLTNFSLKLAKHGFKITFVNTDFNHKRLLKAVPENGSQIRLVSIPDGLGPENDRTEIDQLCTSMLNTMPAKLEELIEDINNGSCDKITCVIADGYAGWAVEVAHKMGIRGAVFWPGAAAIFAEQFSIPSLIQQGILNSDGIPIKEQVIQLSPTMPAMDTTKFTWCCIGDKTSQKSIFHYIKHYVQILNLAHWWICNSAYEIEPASFSFIPKLLPIGPLISSNNPRGQFWPEDPTCLNWLDQQASHSVIYVAFGSHTVLNETQFQELALGLELTNMPFLWVLRPGLINSGSILMNKDCANGTQGKTVSWAPQPEVLSHPAIACFVSHCGWNSTMEGLSNGVPFLCWPYFGDQFFNKSYICDVLKVGIGFEADENGIIKRSEVKKKVEQLLGNNNIRARSSEFKEMAINGISEGGRSSNNFNDFIKWLKA